jgi:hypothetical protein
MAQLWRAQVSGGAAIWAAQNGDGTPSTPTIGAITPTAGGCVFTHSGGGTHYRVFVLAGSPGSWVSLGSSPVTLTGLTVNTEYTLQISGDGSTVADAENWGTLNPGTGSGEPAVPIALQAAEEADAAFRLFLAQVLTPALETDQAVQLLQPGELQAAQETDEAVPLVLITPGAITAAEEQDQAVALLLISPIALGVAVESDAAVSLASTGGLPGGLVRALSRTFVVYPDVMIAGGLPSSTLLRPRFLKDPQARLDYSWDLRPYLAEAADALAGFAVLSSGTVTLEGPYLVDSVVTVVAAGVADGELAELTLRFDTAGGRQDDRTIELQGLQR